MIENALLPADECRGAERGVEHALDVAENYDATLHDFYVVDELVPEEATLPFGDATPSDDVTVFENASGHVGISISPRAHEELWPDVSE